MFDTSHDEKRLTKAIIKLIRYRGALPTLAIIDGILYFNVPVGGLVYEHKPVNFVDLLEFIAERLED